MCCRVFIHGTCTCIYSHSTGVQPVMVLLRYRARLASINSFLVFAVLGPVVLYVQLVGSSQVMCIDTIASACIRCMHRLTKLTMFHSPEFSKDCSHGKLIILFSLAHMYAHAHTHTHTHTQMILKSFQFIIQHVLVILAMLHGAPYSLLIDTIEGSKVPLLEWTQTNSRQ